MQLTAATDRPRVAIGMPVYNAAQLLPAALDSLLSQTYTDFEIVISDNASVDETQAICEQYASRDKRIRYERQEINRGGIWNFNHVFHMSNSEFFKWHAYDDLCEPTYLAKCVEVLDRDPNVVWCHSRSRHIDVAGELLMGPDTPEISYSGESLRKNAAKDVPSRDADRPSERFRAVILGRDGCLDSYAVIRSHVLKHSHLLLPYFGSEKVLMAQLGLWGRYHEIPETLFFARIHAKAAGSQQNAKSQQQYVNPLSKSRLQFPRLGMLKGYIDAVRQSEISLSERAGCYAAIARYLLQVNKWKSVFVKACTGAGLSGEYPSIFPKKKGVQACS